MDCRELRETYTDLIDGLLGEADEIRFHEHLAACPRCHRFDRAYRLGVSALRALPCPRASRAFTTRVLHSVRADPGGSFPSFASGLAGAALVVALIGFLVIDLRVLEHREPAAAASLLDTTVAMAPQESRIDLITIRLPDAAFGPPLWDPTAPVLIRDADLSSRVPFEVPATWTGR